MRIVDLLDILHPTPFTGVSRFDPDVFIEDYADRLNLVHGFDGGIIDMQ